MTKESDLTFAGILVAAFYAARLAAEAHEASLPDHNMWGFDCGFAWVRLPTATTPFARHCRKNKIGSKHYKKGWQFWSPGNSYSQSISTHEAGARAFVEVLRAHGIDCCMDSRLD